MAENPKPVEAPSPLRGALRSARRALLALLILAALWTLWYAYAAVRLNARLRAYRAHGDPTMGRDLVSAPIPPGEDARVLVETAWAELRCSPSESIVLYEDHFPLTPFEMDLMSGLLARAGAAVELLRAARGESTIARHASWPIDPERHNVDRPGISDLGRVVNLCRWAALYNHQASRDDQVYQWLRDFETCAAVSGSGPYLEDHLYGQIVQSRMAELLLRIAPGLAVGSESAGHGMPRAEVFALINYLLDEAPVRRSLRTGFAKERVYILAAADAADHHTGLLRPAFQLDACRTLRRIDGIIAAFEAPEVLPVAVLWARSSFPPDTSNLDRVAYMISNEPGNDNRSIYYVYKGLLYSRAAALALALRLYKFDHGQFPATLAVLVPAYLPSIPGDLFDPAGRPFVYKPAARRFYSVGENGIDDGGDWPRDHALNLNARDFVVPLDP